MGLICICLFVGCSSSEQSDEFFKVEYFGALKNIMKKGDVSAKTDLRLIADRDNLYALGAIENLKGEIQIFDGVPWNSIVSADTIIFDSTYSKKATLLVTAHVKNWIDITIPTDVQNLKALEAYLVLEAKKNNINTNTPFPFMIEGAPQELEWHIIDWKDGDMEHTHEKHITSGLHGTLEDEEVEIIGFYSNKHHAIFTHHTSNVHMHMRTKDLTLAGHVDNLILKPGMILRLPSTLSE